MGPRAGLDVDRIGQMYLGKVYCGTGLGRGTVQNSVQGYILFPVFINLPEKMFFINLLQIC